MAKKPIRENNIAGRIETLKETIEKGKQAKIEAIALLESLNEYGITWILKGSGNPKKMQKSIDRLDAICQGKTGIKYLENLTGVTNDQKL